MLKLFALRPKFIKSPKSAPSPVVAMFTNSMEYIQISTQGNGVDFGDLVDTTRNAFDTVSTAHGGL